MELPNKQGAKDGMNSKLNKTAIILKKEKSKLWDKRTNKLKRKK